MRRYYCVTDFEGVDSYFTRFSDAKKTYDLWVKIRDGLGQQKRVVTMKSFELPKLPKPELVMRLLGQYAFMSNVKELYPKQAK